MHDWPALGAFLLASFTAAAIGSAFTYKSVRTWYPTLKKPPGTPPSWVFGPVWTTLYILMSVAAWRVWLQRSADVRVPLVLFFTQLALNAIWSVLFFGLRRPGVALIEVVLLWSMIVATVLSFSVVSVGAAWLMVPYALWVSYATYLNAGIWRKNRPGFLHANSRA